jgi:CubicO group peptidase (beta-lactamase class C family)
MGGVTGHAGLFSTAGDLARFARMILHGGTLDGVQVIRPETVAGMTAVQTPPALPDQRGLGWDINTGYSRPRGSLFPLTSFGHTGFTGTCMWLDPGSGAFYVFLTSRLHGTRGRTRVLELYTELGTLAAQAAGYAVAAGGAGL